MRGSPITMDLATCVALAFTPLSGAPPSLRSPELLSWQIADKPHRASVLGARENNDRCAPSLPHRTLAVVAVTCRLGLPGLISLQDCRAVCVCVHGVLSFWCSGGT